MYTTLLFYLHIPNTQKWAGGHRYSLRRNVCRPATTRTHAYTKKYLEMIFNQSQGVFII